MTTVGQVLGPVVRPGLVRVRRLPATSSAVVLLVVLLLAYVVTVTVTRGPEPATTGSAFPTSAALEQATGVTFSRVAVVGDGGLVMVEYVVDDVEKATAFQADRAHVPSIASEVRDGGTHRVSIMKPGHLIRAGQTYYLVYQNTGAAVRSGDWVTLTYLGHALRHVPVL